MAFLRSQISSLARWASTAVMLLLLSAQLSAVSARPLPLISGNLGQIGSIEFSINGRLSAERSLLQIIFGKGTWAMGDSSDPTAICTVVSDDVLEIWQPSANFVEQLGSATKLSLTKADSLPEVSAGTAPFLAEVHPEWDLVDTSDLPPSRLFFGYNGAPNRPVVFGPNWTLKSGAVVGSNFWMFGVAPGTSQKDVASLALIKLTSEFPLELTYIDSVKALPAGYQWYQATQPIGN